ncbi:phospholipid carrier-dependent glycosyltransferase [candidate division WOR-3 bacterium]|nr:phospholipid carrier-dependent glycosyltransferase [candidate division WOR-3 bacterium]
MPALLGLYVVFSLLLFDPKPATFGDNARYLILGKALAQGAGYRDLHLPEAPEHTQYPPGFPLMLAAVTILGGGVNVPAAKLLVLLSGLAAMFFIYRVCRLTFEESAWPAMAVVASLPMLVENNHWVLSEMPFLLMTTAALYCLVLADSRPKLNSMWLRISAGALAILSCYVRTAGLAVVLGVAFYFLVRRQYRSLGLFLLAAAAALLPWQLRNARANQGQPYLEQLLAKHPYFLEQGRAGFSDWVLRVWQNLRDYTSRVVPRMVCPTRENTWYEAVIGVVLSLLTGLGWWKGLKRHTALAGCALGAGPVLLGWPYIWLTERFLLPFLPLVVVFLFGGVRWLSSRLKWRWFVPGLAGLLVLANAVRMHALARQAIGDNLGYLKGDHYSGYPIDWRRYFEAIEWIKANTPENALVLARKPEFVYLLSGRRSFCYPISRDHAQVKAALQRSQYVLADNFAWTETTPVLLGPVLQANPELWELAFTTPEPEFYVLKVRAGPAD